MNTGEGSGPTNPELVELQALRLVIAGAVTVADGGYVRTGRPITGELAAVLVRLHAAGCLSVGTPGPDGHRPVQPTMAGAVQAAELGAYLG